MQAENSSTEIVDEKEDLSVLELARARFKIASEAEKDLRTLALDDLKFSAGEQWPELVKQAREKENRPCLTINRLPQFIRQVTNDQRQNRPSIKVYPVDDKADVETAKILQGIIRHIEYNSNADVAYDTAFDGAVRKGIGYFRIVTDYCDPGSFDQEILIKRIRNSFTVYFDPSSQEPDGSDANWAFIVETLSRDDFKAQYKNTTLATMADWESIGDEQADWVSKDGVKVAEYFYKTWEEKTLVQLSDGTTALEEELPPAESLALAGVQVVNKRKTILPAIKWAKICGTEIIEETDWPGRWIPIIPVIGDEIDLNGEKILEGIVRHAKDSMRMYNYWASSETEMIALAPKAPYIGAAGQFKGREKMWAQANRQNFAYLEYEPVANGNVQAPPPSRNVYEPPVQAINHARMLASEDLKATTGIYDASLGAKSNENSGIAIQRRNLQAQTSNFHFVDNLARSQRHCGRQLVDLIPKIYDTARAQRIIGEEGEQQIVRINEMFEKSGQQVIYNLGAGKYDVVCETGPSFATKRQEARESMVDLAKVNPQIAQVAGDLMVKAMDWPGAPEIAERLKKMLPPGIAEEKDGDKKPVPPEIAGQMNQMNQMIEALTQQLNEKSKLVEMKTLELESKERIEFAKLENTAAIEMAKLQSTEALEILSHQMAEISSRLDLLRMDQPIETENLEAPMGADPEQGFEQMGMNEQPPTGGQSPGQFME